MDKITLWYMDATIQLMADTKIEPEKVLKELYNIKIDKMSLLIRRAQVDMWDLMRDFDTLKEVMENAEFIRYKSSMTEAINNLDNLNDSYEKGKKLKRNNKVNR